MHTDTRKRVKVIKLSYIICYGVCGNSQLSVVCLSFYSSPIHRETAKKGVDFLTKKRKKGCVSCELS